jgi:hypothetical protein
MTHMSRSGLQVHVGNPDHFGAVEVALFLVAVALACIALAPATPVCNSSCSWLFTSFLLWVCTSPAWLRWPNREQIKRLFVGGAVAFASIAAAVFVGMALTGQLARGLV